MGLVRLFRRDPPAPVSAAVGHATREAVAPPIEPLMQQLEDDVLLTMRVIQHKAGVAKDRIDDSVGLVEEIGRANDELAHLADAARATIAALTAATGRLDEATRSIDMQTASADLFAAEARQLTDDVSRSMHGMEEAVARIAGVAQLIGTIARRTNLLALNAGIEAARAGPAGRGFAVIAAEIKALAQKVHRATEDVGAQSAQLQAASRQSGEGMTRMARLMERIEPIFNSVRATAELQAAETREASRNAAQGADFVGVVAARAAAVKDIGAKAVGACRHAGEAADDMNLSLQRHTQRAMVFLRHSARESNRRRERVPARLDGAFTIEGLATPVIVLDLSTGGVLLDAAALDLSRGASGILRLPGIGSLPSTVVARSELGLHVRFDSIDPICLARVEAAMEAAKAAFVPLVLRVQAAARDVEAAFAHGLATAEVLIDELITTDYRPVPDTNPVQYDTTAMPFYETVLPPILEAHRSGDPRPIFVLAVDRNAFLPVHHPELSQPQRLGQTAWNDLNSRHRRLLDRWQTLIGARNQEASHQRIYMRHGQDGAATPILMISCPISLSGRHWGNVEVGFDIAAPIS